MSTRSRNFIDPLPSKPLPSVDTTRSQTRYFLGGIFLILTLLCMGCPLEIDLICNGKTVGAIIEISFETEEDQVIEGRNILNQLVRTKAAGAHMEVGVKPGPGMNLKDCCPEGQLVWRQWVRSNKSLQTHAANTWYPDIVKGSRNLPTYPPTEAQKKEGFHHRFVDRPARPVHMAKDGDLTWEAIAVFGCLFNGQFTPLASFKWGWEMDSDGDVSLESLSKVDLATLKKMNLP